MPGIKALNACWAEAVREIRARAVPDVSLKLLPRAILVADFLAGGADGQKAAQLMDPAERLLQFGNELRGLSIGRNTGTDVADDGAGELLSLDGKYGRGSFQGKQ